MNITLRHFELVESVTKCQSITRAASMLDMTQPALTRAIKTLEDQIGKELFSRTPRGLEPTEAGKTFLTHYTKIATSLSSILNEIDQIKSISGGTLTVATGLFAGHSSVYAAVGAMSKIYPKLQIEIIQKDWHVISKEILANEIDLGVIDLGLAQADPEFQTELLNTSEVCFFVRPDHPLVHFETLTLDDLKKFPLCNGQLPPRAASFFGDNLGALGRYEPLTGTIMPALHTYNLSAIFQVLAHSDAISLAPRRVIQRMVERHDIVILDQFRHQGLRAHFGFAHLRNRALPPVLREFMSIVRNIELKNQISFEHSPPPPPRKRANSGRRSTVDNQ
jgi:DNA-binding transcriptional LysR family regulator